MIGIVAHDAGGAEIISSYISKENLDCGFFIEGPAKNVFERKIKNIKTFSLEELVSLSDSIICGSSFLSDLEWRAIGLAKNKKKRSVVVLDHWINYRERFFRHGEWRWPNEVWVGDRIALDLARAIRLEAPIRLVRNAYFDEIKNEILLASQNQAQKINGLNILYVCEPLRDDAIALFDDELHWGYVEEDAVNYFLSNIDCLNLAINNIIVRPHPQEEDGKYDWVLNRFSLPLICEKNKTLVEQIASSDIVVGCATMAMYIGLLAGKRVLSCIPPGGKTIPLPHLEIENMNDLIAIKAKQNFFNLINKK